MSHLRTAAQAAFDALYYIQRKAESQRIWGGMDWHYHYPWKGVFDKCVEQREALRAALAQQGMCEWVDDGALFQSSCGCAYPRQEVGGNHPRDYMKFCTGCGKPIKFLESEHE